MKVKIFFLLLSCAVADGMEKIDSFLSETVEHTIDAASNADSDQIERQGACRICENRLQHRLIDRGDCLPEIISCGGATFYVAAVKELWNGVSMLSNLPEILEKNGVCVSAIPVEIIESHGDCVKEKALCLAAVGTLFCVPLAVKKCVECCRKVKEN